MSDRRRCVVDGESYDAAEDLNHAHDPEHPNHYDYENVNPDLGWAGPTCPECPTDVVFCPACDEPFRTSDASDLVFHQHTAV